MLNLRLNDCFMDFGGFPIMRRAAKFAVLRVLGTVLLLSGCTTYVSVASDPEGAVITSADGSETYGRAPVTIESLKSSKAPTNYFTPNILRKSWSRLVVSVVHLDALAFPVAAT